MAQRSLLLGTNTLQEATHVQGATSPNLQMTELFDNLLMQTCRSIFNTPPRAPTVRADMHTALCKAGQRVASEAPVLRVGMYALAMLRDKVRAIVQSRLHDDAWSWVLFVDVWPLYL